LPPIFQTIDYTAVKSGKDTIAFQLLLLDARGRESVAKSGQELLCCELAPVIYRSRRCCL